MFFTFPEDAHWDDEEQSVVFGVEIGEYRGLVRVPRRVFQRLPPERPTPERCVEAYYLQRTRFERIAERKLRRRQLSEDGNVEITGVKRRAIGTPDRHAKGTPFWHWFRLVPVAHRRAPRASRSAYASRGSGACQRRHGGLPSRSSPAGGEPERIPGGRP